MRFVERLVDERGRVSVVTVIEVPRSFLDTLRSEQWHPLEERSWISEEDAGIARYVEERGGRVTEPIMAALRGRGITAEAHYLEGEDPAGTIVAAAEQLDADVVILGATRPLFDEAAWESISARVMRDARRPVLVIPATPRSEPLEDA